MRPVSAMRLLQAAQQASTMARVPLNSHPDRERSRRCCRTLSMAFGSVVGLTPHGAPTGGPSARTTRASPGRARSPRDLPRPREQAARALDHRQVDHLPLEGHRAPALGKRRLEGGDQPARALDLGR